MPKKIPLKQIGVSRDGTSINPTIGKPFDFTDAEVADMDRFAAATGEDYYRDPVNEVDGEAVPEPKKAGGKKAGTDEL